MMHFKVLMCLGFLTVGVREVMSAYGGGACNLPAAAPGATTQCTGTANGFCALDTISTTAPVATTGKCVCYYGYSGTACATYTDPNSSSSSSSANNVIGALALGGLGAYALSQLGGGASQTPLGIGPGSEAAQDAFYLRQSVNPGFGK
ncbi:uncharacterized protein LOC125676763 [Ostrea edulis]|uniref:uncharacterized protein LOC125676763 n=1 Tax=Ostrea edulis TaxID=37623 RepID=UPI0024AF70D3|nr:uncharacterized protein LOC125676763 [Ostrea edulis]XP_056015821.1 uncharacterized protein LOC125676763 [Ostrea edulis]